MSSSQTKSDSRIYVGNLPPDIKSRDLEDLFYKYGKIKFVDLKNRKGPPFAFVEFDDSRDAEDAVKGRDGYNFDGYRIRVEFQKGSRGGSRASSSYRGGGGAPPRRSDYRIQVSGLPPTGSWQDLKDHMREAGQVCYADVFKDGTGVVEFIYYDDMKYAVKKLDDTKFRSHEGETSYIRIREDSSRRRSSSRSRSRSRSTSAKRRERQSPTYSPDRRSRSRSRSRRSDDDYDRKKRSSRKYSPSRSRSRSPSHSRSRSRSRGGSRSRSRSVASRSRSNSRHRSRSNSRKRDSSVPPVPVAADTATNGNGLDSPSVKRRAESPGGEQKRVRRSASQESEPNNDGHDQENNNGTSELPQSESQQPIDE